MISKKRINKVVKGVVAAMPAIPYIMKSRRSTSIASYVVAGIGFAVAGGLCALMFLSPRTRSRALNAAKGTYGKVSDKIGHLREGRHAEQPMSNGLVGNEYGSP
jgi:hypothetical protein